MCPKCGGHQQVLGVLGRTLWFRCRDCGWETCSLDTAHLEVHDLAQRS